MTAIAGAAYPGGVVIVAESKCVIGGVDEGVSDNKAVKVVRLGARDLVAAVAGNSDLDITSIGTGHRIYVMNLLGLLARRIIASDSSDVLGEAMTCVKRFGFIHGFVETRLDKHVIELLLGHAPPTDRPRLYLIRSKAPEWSVSVSEPKLAWGAGVFEFYCHAAERRLERIPEKYRTKVEALLQAESAPPSFPRKMFESKAEAESWARSVVEWCVESFPDLCEGPIVYGDTDQDDIIPEHALRAHLQMRDEIRKQVAAKRKI